MIAKWFSFLYPLTRKIDSRYSGKLELTMINGKKVLDTKNTNYSYGSLQRVMRYSLNQIDMSHTGSVLLLGLGGGSVVKTIREEKSFAGKITAVEIDPVIIEIAGSEFGIVADPTTEIIQANAWNFVMNCRERYDLVIVDVFIDNVVPQKFLSNEFWKSLLMLVQPGGDIVFNTLCNPASDLREIESKFHRRGIEYRIHRHVENTNKVLIAHYNAPRQAC